jgi:hypothetical protein
MRWRHGSAHTFGGRYRRLGTRLSTLNPTVRVEVRMSRLTFRLPSPYDHGPAGVLSLPLPAHAGEVDNPDCLGRIKGLGQHIVRSQVQRFRPKIVIRMPAGHNQKWWMGQALRALEQIFPTAGPEVALTQDDGVFDLAECGESRSKRSGPRQSPRRGCRSQAGGLTDDAIECGVIFLYWTDR